MHTARAQCLLLLPSPSSSSSNSSHPLSHLLNEQRDFEDVPLDLRSLFPHTSLFKNISFTQLSKNLLKMNYSTPFTSPMGPLHFSHPSQMTAFVLPLPSSSRIRSFFRSSSSTPSSSSSKDKPSHQAKKEEKLTVEFESRKGSTFTPLETPSSPPPSYSQATEEDLYCEDIVVESKENELKERRANLIEEDRRMNEALKSIGF